MQVAWKSDWIPFKFLLNFCWLCVNREGNKTFQLKRVPDSLAKYFLLKLKLHVSEMPLRETETNLLKLFFAESGYPWALQECMFPEPQARSALSWWACWVQQRARTALSLHSLWELLSASEAFWDSPMIPNIKCNEDPSGVIPPVQHPLLHGLLKPKHCMQPLPANLGWWCANALISKQWGRSDPAVFSYLLLEGKKKSAFQFGSNLRTPKAVQ